MGSGFLASVPSFGTDGLTLEQAVQEGVGESPTLKKYSSATDEASWGKVLGLSALVPHVDLVANHFFDSQYRTTPVLLGGTAVAVPGVYPKNSYGAEVRWTVFDGLGNVRSYEASRKLFAAAEQEFSRKEFETRKKIELAYFNALAARRFADVAAENVKTLEENNKQVVNRARGGVSTQYDVLRVEVQLSDARTELERTEDSVVIQRKNLAVAMGKTDDDRVLQGQLPEPSSVEAVRSIATPELSARSDFEAARLRSEAAANSASAANGHLLPSIGFQAQYERYENTGYPGEAYGGYRNAWNIGLFARWTLFDGGATVAHAGQARAVAAQADHSYQEAVQALPKEFELWRRRYIYSAHRFESKKADLKRSEESFRIATLSFQQGRKTITEVLEAESDLFRSRAGVVQAQLDAEEARVNLELTIGRTI